ncbi:LCP family protein [Brevibacillus daliensis]|uniref:LCP family protein n=1 Tax=Brevibacillus daliensis TaxID=2892995 RepID=UPI001E287177|nr:LCP family protein [Brevibacillus daliensis]
MKPYKDWKKSTKWLVRLTLLILVIMLGLVAYSTWKLYDTAATIYHPIERISSEPRLQSASYEHEDLKEKTTPQSAQPSTTEETTGPQVTTLLIFGIDRRPDTQDIGRTDVIMLAILNKDTNKITLTSIPRDTYVEIAGQGYSDKINAAYQYGIETSIATVENFTGVLVDQYVLFNFDGFEKAIDSMGGLKLEVDSNLGEYLKISVGTQLLNGQQVLDYARFRNDAKGDFGRNERQQNVIKAVLEQSKELRNPGKIKSILDTVGEDVRTDLDLSRIISLASDVYDFSTEHVEQIKYNATTARFGPRYLSYVVIDEKERKRVAELLQQSMINEEKSK